MEPQAGASTVIVVPLSTLGFDLRVIDYCIFQMLAMAYVCICGCIALVFTECLHFDLDDGIFAPL